jgi:hypothetical protein
LTADGLASRHTGAAHPAQPAPTSAISTLQAPRQLGGLTARGAEPAASIQNAIVFAVSAHHCSSRLLLTL